MTGGQHKSLGSTGRHRCPPPGPPPPLCFLVVFHFGHTHISSSIYTRWNEVFQRFFLVGYMHALEYPDTKPSCFA